MSSAVVVVLVLDSRAVFRHLIIHYLTKLMRTYKSVSQIRRSGNFHVTKTLVIVGSRGLIDVNFAILNIQFE